jgi:hypothetical protein
MPSFELFDGLVTCLSNMRNQLKRETHGCGVI